MIDTLDVTDSYMKVLSTLSVDKKLDIIVKLTDSIRRSESYAKSTTKHDPFANLSGAWEEDGRNAEELVDEIRAARHFDRNVKML